MLEQIIATIADSAVLIAIILVACIAFVSIVLRIFYLALKQGHTITLWPPKIEAQKEQKILESTKVVAIKDDNSKLLSTSSSYVVEQSSFLIDFTCWTDKNVEGNDSIVVVERIDDIIKTKNKNIDYSHPYYTTGDKIICEPISYPIEPIFELQNAPDVQNGKAYDYVLALGEQPKNYKTSVANKFTFKNGFSDPNNEWWAASIKYPTDKVVVIFQFQIQKPSRNMEVSLRTGHSNAKPFKSHRIKKFNNGQIILWIGEKIPENSRIYFNFLW